MGGLVFVAIGLSIGAALGWPAFFIARSSQREVRALRAQIDHLLSSRTAAEPSRPESAASPNLTPSSAASMARSPAPEAEAAAISATRRAARGAEPATPRVDASTEKTGPRPSAKLLEARLAGDWLVWLGGVALVLGGAFMVRAAADAGYFGPSARIGLALAAGSAMIGVGDRLRRAGSRALTSAVAAGAGASTIYGAIYAAYGLYELVPSLAALFALALTAAGFIALAVLHRAPAMAALALVGANAAPVLTATGEPNAGAFLLYVFGVAAAGVVAARIMAWPRVGRLALIGALGWPALMILGGADADYPLAVYLPALIALGAASADAAAAAPFRPPAVFPLRLRGRAPPSADAAAMRVYWALALGAIGLAVLHTAAVGLAPAMAAMWLAFAALAFGLAAVREGLSLTPALVGAAAALALALAGRAHGGADAFALLAGGAAYAAAFGFGGFALMGRRDDMAPLAAASAFTPILLLAGLFIAAPTMVAPAVWGALAVALSLSNAAALMALGRGEDGFNAVPGAASAYVLGGALAAALAVSMAADGLAMSAGLALLAPLGAWLWRRFGLPALRFAAACLAFLSTVRLVLLPEVLASDVGSLPVLNGLILAYLLPAVGFWTAARLFEGGGVAMTARLIQALEGAAALVFAAFVSLEIRHALNGGDLRAGYDDVIEISLQTIAWLGVAAFLRLRFKAALTPVRLWTTRVLGLLAAGQTLLGPLLQLNPWWGSLAAPVAGPPVVNLLALYYLAPAVAFAVYARAVRAALWEARLAGLLAALTAYAWTLLAARHGFHRPDLSVGLVGDAESWAYSTASIAFATLVLIAGAIRRSLVFRAVGLGAILLAAGKVFVFDMAGLEGVWRATSFLGLGAALLGVAALYQRVVAPLVGGGENARAASPSEPPV